MAAYLMEKSDLIAASAVDGVPREEFVVSGVTLESVERFGKAIADGIMDFSEAHDLLVRAAINKDPDADVDDLELRLGTALSDAAALAEGLPVSTVQMRQDTHPSLARLLRLDATLSANEAQVANLLNGASADGTAIANRPPNVSIGYIDLTWSASKEVSLAWAFAPTERERSIIFNAHKEAVETSMWYVAGVIGRARRGDGGSKGSDPGHITWMEFHHQTSRPTLQTKDTDAQGREYTLSTRVPVVGDPMLHTHVTVPNVVLTDDGRIGSLDLQKLDGRIKEFGAYYQAHLATNLRRHGVEVSFNEKHTELHVHGVPDYVRRHFSKRATQAEERARELAKEQGVDFDSLSGRQKAGFLTNVVKSARRKLTGGRADFADWQRQAKAIGWQHRSVLRPGQEQTPLPEAERIEAAYRAALPLLQEEFQRRAVLTDEDIRVMACYGLIAGITGRRDIDKVTAEFRRQGVTHRGKPTALVWAPDPRGRHRLAITTDLHESEEAELIGLVRESAGDRSRSLRLKALNQAVQRSALDFTTSHGREQLRAMRTLATGGRFGVVIGVAGSGKSAMLRPLVDAWHASGKRTIGLALAWRQTEALADAGIEHRFALHGYLLRQNDIHPKGAAPLDRNTVLVIDEVGQVGTHQLLQLARLQKETGCSIVALGDDRQCQSIEAGPVIDLLHKAFGKNAIPELLITVRQQTERERAISYLFRDGGASAAIAMKREDSTARLVAGSYQDTVNSIASLWRQRVEANAADPHYRLTVMAPTNADAREVSAAIRKQRQDMGLVGKDERVINAVDQMGEAYELPLAVGDNIRLFDRINAVFSTGHGNIGNNGSVLQVREMTEDTITLRDRNGRDGVVKWETLRSGARIRLAHGDVLTIDAGQGITSTEHIDAMPSGSAAVNGFKAYVTESRHRRVSFMVVSDGAERTEIARKRSIGDPTPISEEDVWRNVARNLSRQTTKESATAMLQRLSSVQRSAAWGLKENAQRQSAWHYSRFVQGLSQAASLVMRSMRFSSQTLAQRTTLGP